MELIKGSESLFYIVRNGILFPVCCLTSNPIDENAEMMETTTRDNEGWRTSIPTLQGYSIALEGFMTFDDVIGQNIISYRELRRIKRNKELIVWVIKTLGGQYVDSGKAYIDKISFTDPIDDFIGFSASLVGYGIPNDTNAEYDIYADNVTYSFTYSHEPIDTTNEGQWFLINLLFNNYHNSFGITYDCDLKIKLFGIPVKGFLANNLTRQIYQVGDIISYCDKDNLVYFPNGFDNDLGVTGNYIELFTYKIIDQEDRIGRLIIHTISMTDSAVEPIDISVAISWLDLTSTPKTGNLANITVKVASLVFDPLDPIISQEWEIFNGTDWVFYKNYTADLEVIALSYLENKIRFKAVTEFGVSAYSNILQYTKANSSSIYISEEIQDNGRTTYKLNVEEFDFSGFMILKGEKNLNTRNSNINDAIGNVLIIPNINTIGDIVYKSIAVNYPIGVYDLEINAVGFPKNASQIVQVFGSVGFGYSNDFDESITTANVELYMSL